MNGFKSQQHRWTKGSIQTARKLLPAIFRSAYPWKVKAEAFFHLTNNFSHLLVVLLALLIVPAIIIRERSAGGGWRSRLSPLLRRDVLLHRVLRLLAAGDRARLEADDPIHASPAVARNRAVSQQRRTRCSRRFPLASRISGGRRSSGSRARDGEWRTKKYRAPGNYSLVAEILLAAYFLAAIVFAAKQNYWVGVPFLLVFFNGFAYTARCRSFSRFGAVPFTAQAAEAGRAACPGVEAAPGA